MDYVKDPLTQEVDAMAIIGQLLGKLPDAAARQRVLKWAAERYGSEVMTQAPSSAAQAPARGDSSLAVDSLNDMFTQAQPADDDLSVPAFEAAAEEPKPPVSTVIQSFARELRRFADEWKGAAA